MDVVVIHIDGLQPAAVGAYGCDWVDTPAIDALAARGVVFDQHFSDDLHRDQLEGVDRVTRVELNTLRPPWKLSARDLAKYFKDDADEDAEPLEPWLDALPERIDANDDDTFERIQRTYAAAVTKMDAKLSKLLVRHRDEIVIMTSNRGFALGEHGEVGFADCLHEESVHLPLIIAWPDSQFAGRRVASLTQPMDLPLTIAELLGDAIDSSGDPVLNGRSLLPMITSPLATIRKATVIRNGPLSGIRTPNWYYIRDPQHDAGQLFVKPDDRWEVNDVQRHHPAICEEMEAIIARCAQSISPAAT